MQLFTIQHVIKKHWLVVNYSDIWGVYLEVMNQCQVSADLYFDIGKRQNAFVGGMENVGNSLKGLYLNALLKINWMKLQWLKGLKPNVFVLVLPNSM